MNSYSTFKEISYLLRHVVHCLVLGLTFEVLNRIWHDELVALFAIVDRLLHMIVALHLCVLESSLSPAKSI